MLDYFGLYKEDLECIISCLRKENEVEEAIIFGSRAKGNFKKGSDIDIALKGGRLNHSVVNKVSLYLNEETLMPYSFDIINRNTISNPHLAEHIDNVGISIYVKR